MSYNAIGYLFVGHKARKGLGDEYWRGNIIVDGKKINITVFKNKKQLGTTGNNPDLVIYGNGGYQPPKKKKGGSE